MNRGSTGSTSITCATRPTSSAIRSCRWCTSSSRCAATPVATSIGARRHRTSWTPRSCCRCEPHSTSSTPTSASCAASLPAWPRKHRDTPMAGRTHLQQALPVTFGYKVAIWLAMFDRHQQRLAELRPRVDGGRVRRRCRHAGIAGRQGLRGAAGPGRRTGPGCARDHMARRSRRACRGGEPARAGHRFARQDRARHHDHGVDRVRRGLRAVRQRARRAQHDAAEAQPDLQSN